LKPSLPKGTRDYLPAEIRKRNYIFDIIRDAFHRFGYEPIETPAMESLQTLTGKYGDEGDKLLFKIINNGDFLSDVPEDIYLARESKDLLPLIAKRGLRYDLTVPFARYLVMNRNQLKLPFKRSAIQPVWRADRPQRGRYQEFYQCDADIAGTASLYSECELIQLYDSVFAALKLPVQIRLNHRKLLQGIIQHCGMGERFSEVAGLIDKLDKMGFEKLGAEMGARGFDPKGIKNLFRLIQDPTLSELKQDSLNELVKTGIEELTLILDLSSRVGLHNSVVFDPTLARGLSYYTGCILEVVAIDANMGSIGGGGRYDDLTGSFGMPGIPGVGISFGAERIYDLMEEKGLFPDHLQSGGKLIFLSLDAECMSYTFGILMDLRKGGLACEFYPEPAKINKMMSYANDRGFDYVALVGLDEMNASKVTLKNMKTGEQKSVNSTEIKANLSF